MHPQDAESSQRACAPASITKYMSLAFSHPYTLEHAHEWIAMNKEAPHSKLAFQSLEFRYIHAYPLNVTCGHISYA